MRHTGSFVRSYATTAVPASTQPIGYRPMLVGQRKKYFELPHYYHNNPSLLPVIVGELSKWIKQRIVSVESFSPAPQDCVLPMLLEETKPRLWLVQCFFQKLITLQRSNRKSLSDRSLDNGYI